MSDKLKDFVQAHRQEFDSFTPRPDLWQDIAADLKIGQTAPKETPAQEAKVISLNWNIAWRYAAAVALLVMVAFSAMYFSNNGAQPASTLAANQPVPLEKIAPELKAIETQYVQVIEKKESELKAMGAGNVNFAGLDSAYNELKKELYTTPNKEVLLQAMSDNLKMRIALLNQQLEVIENRSNVKTPARHETTNI